MKKIAFCNAKGGVAKTTCCVNIGAGLARLNYKTLLIDLDTQGQVTQSLGLTAEKGLAELIEGTASFDEAKIEARENLFVIAGGQDLAGIKRMIARREMRSEMVLAETLNGLNDFGLNDFDYVLLDTAPSRMMISVFMSCWLDRSLLSFLIGVLPPFYFWLLCDLRNNNKN